MQPHVAKVGAEHALQTKAQVTAQRFSDVGWRT
ncbi:hypothetical protein STAFG_5773 [Streptomyces afghaniensis 772]|uniref:Uncharacterized protein n=1 Tax=Streptomyces afghaniensis 772 TaxID=1283301 RepID=S4MKL2_9ACTN|nr:hypothetical protein STAFG_5773 [Streptomyces afghaniensis 772]